METNKQNSFSDRKEKIIKMVDDLMGEYDEFTKMVSPKHWRITGSHFCELRKIKEELPNFSNITKKELENIKTL